MVEIFETSLEGTGFSRGCPDYIYTILTFGAVSLLKGTQKRFKGLKADHSILIGTARKAASILARAATSSDHLPAALNAFLTRLVQSRTQTQSNLAANAGPNSLTMDFAAFAQSLDLNTSQTPWPPGPSQTVADDHTTIQAFSSDMGEMANPLGWLTGQLYSFPEAAASIDDFRFMGDTSNDLDMWLPQESTW